MSKQQSRRIAAPRLTQIAALLATTSFAAMLGGTAFAQAAPDAPKDKDDVVGLDRVVVTASSQAKSKMRSSVSVTDVDQDQIKDFAPRTEAEVLLLIPGIRTDSTAGPGGNSNISVRGIPIASGGSKYVQLQEDGLPTVQFGDMNFSNNDYWIRFDNNVDHIQTLRGGSASTFASQAPGAVINYISKTGKEQGGSIGLSRGLNYNETRVDGDYGAQISKDMYYHVGGYYREGEGTRNAPANSLNGYQLKGNLTKEFNGGKGYVRVNFKLLNEHAPTTPQTFLNASVNGTTVGGFSKTSGYDGTRDSQYSIYNSSFTSVNPVTRAIETTSLVDGISVNSKSLGFEFHNELDNGWSVDDKFRKSSNSGAFQAQFWNVQTRSNLIANFGSGATKGVYANGPLAGQDVTDANLKTGLVSQSAAINTQTPDMGNLVNDLSVNKQFKFGSSTLDTRLGFFHSRQNVVQRWAISERVMEAAPNGALIDVYAVTPTATTQLTSSGLTGYNNQWGACCARDINANFTTDAPYLSLSFATGNLDLDLGVRQESFSANGTYSGSKLFKDGTIGIDVNGDGVITGLPKRPDPLNPGKFLSPTGEYNVYISDTTNPGRVNYRINYTNFSLGANYRILPDLSVFARYSEGHRAIADRLLFSANIDAVTGQLTSGGKEAAVAPVKQSEIGVKYRGKFTGGSYGLAATFFHSTTNEFDFDQTRDDRLTIIDPITGLSKPNPGYQGPKLNQVGTKADGLEFESSFAVGNFGISANLTITDEKIASNLGNPSAVGKAPGGVPRARYTISPRYAFGNAVIGATFRGQSNVYTGDDNTKTIDGHVITSAFVNYDFGNGLMASLNANNLFDKLACAGGGGFVGGSSTVFGCGVVTGRTISAAVKYSF